MESFIQWLTESFQPLFSLLGIAIHTLNAIVHNVLTSVPWWLLIAFIALLALWRRGLLFAFLAVAGLLLIAAIDLFDQTLETLTLVISSTFICLTVGLPLGIVMAKRPFVEAIIRPLLDFMQTMPAFVYLIPAVMLFGLGELPATLATVIFAMPPIVRLTCLGIQQVPYVFKEAADGFGCTGMQKLIKVELPLAKPSIMAGINQTNMLALSMVVIASMIGAGGLGNTVLTGIQRLDVSLGFEGGISVVIIAILLDRLTQSFQEPIRKI